MDPELIKELSEESSELFENIKKNIDALSSDNPNAALESIKRDAKSIIGAAEMFGVDSLANALKNLIIDLQLKENGENFDQNIIGELQSTLIQARMTLDIDDNEISHGPIITIRVDEPDDYRQNQRSFGIKLFALEDDRHWEYKHIMLELGGLDMRTLEHPDGSENGILIVSTECYNESLVEATKDMNVLVIGDSMEDKDHTYVLPRSVDPAAILAVCKIINRYT